MKNFIKYKPLFVLFISFFSFPFISFSGQSPEDMVYIPAGEFVMGSDESVADKIGGIVPVDEMPKRKVYLKAFYVDKYEVTNKKYKEYLDSLKAKGIKSFSHYNDEGIPIPDRWSLEMYPEGEDNFPVVDVDWYMANKYCEAHGKRLPTEEEWEKAARGTDGRIYPWGNDYKPEYSNNREYWEKVKGVKMTEGKPFPVGSFKKDVSPYGVYDMSGNALEWTSSLYRPYQGNELKRDIFSKEVYVLRGGTFNALPYEFGRASSRHFRQPTDSRSAHAGWHSDMNIGIRCVKDAE